MCLQMYGPNNLCSSSDLKINKGFIEGFFLRILDFEEKWLTLHVLCRAIKN